MRRADAETQREFRRATIGEVFGATGGHEAASNAGASYDHA